MKHTRIQIIPGSGVNTDYFSPKKLLSSKKNKDKKIIFLLVARLLKDKGVGEYVEAARIIKKQYPDAEFQLL